MTTDLPTLSTLHAHRLAYEVGATAAERCAKIEELRPYWPAYERRALDFRMALAIVDAQIASLPKHTIHPDACREDTRRLSAARKARQVTWREYGLRMWFLRRQTHAH
jgi:hypothetical protein